MKRPALRWKRAAKLRGLQAIGAGPRPWYIEPQLASVNPLVEQHTVKGWYYVVTSNSGLPHFNSYSAGLIYPDDAQAKAAAVKHIRDGWAKQVAE